MDEINVSPEETKKSTEMTIEPENSKEITKVINTFTENSDHTTRKIEDSNMKITKSEMIETSGNKSLKTISNVSHKESLLEFKIKPIAGCSPANREPSIKENIITTPVPTIFN